MNKFTKGLLNIVNKNGQSLVYDAAGNLIQGQIMSRLTDEVDERPMLLLKTIVNICDSEEDMDAKIAAANAQS